MQMPPETETLSELTRSWKLKDGTPILLRPIRPEDADIEKRFVSQLSARSKYFRFFCGLNELTPAMLSRFTRIDYEHEMAIVAILQNAAAEIEIAVGRFAPCSDEKTCEFAIVVADKWQNQGIGHQIMADLIQAARTRGFENMKGLILSTNSEMIQMAADLGFRILPDPEDASVVNAIKKL